MHFDLKLLKNLSKFYITDIIENDVSNFNNNKSACQRDFVPFSNRLIHNKEYLFKANAPSK